MTEDLTEFDNPNSDANLERRYNNLMAHRYDTDYHSFPIMQRHTMSFVEYLSHHLPSNGVVLDLGCASGSLWNYFHDKLPSSTQVIGVDLSPAMIEVARNKFPNGDFRLGSLTEIPVADRSIDVVVVSSAFHHLADEALPNSLREIDRVLMEHGKLVGREPLSTGRIGDRGGALAGGLMTMRHIAYRLTGAKDYPEPDPGPDHHAYDAESFLQAIENYFPIINISFRNPVSHFVARSVSPVVIQVALKLDDILSHKEGQEVHYVAQKNSFNLNDHESIIDQALIENKVEDITKFLAYLDEAGRTFQALLSSEQPKSAKRRRRLSNKRIRSVKNRVLY